MYNKRMTGYIPCECRGNTAGSYLAVKAGRMLTLKEEREAARLTKSVELAAARKRGGIYYQIIANQGACEECESHGGAIYPIENSAKGENLPPFHPNCECTAEPFSADNPRDDPWRAEVLMWLEIMYGDGSLGLKAQKLLEFYSWEKYYSALFIERVLAAIQGIEHIGRRMEAFFRLLDTGLPDEDVTFRLPGVHFVGVTGRLGALVF